MKILHLTNAYPTEDYSSYGIFIKEQIDSLNGLGFVNDYFFVNAREKGKLEYLRCVPEIRKIIKNYDLIHCHHVYTTVPFLLSFSGRPFILSLLGDIKNRKKTTDNILLRVAINRAEKIIYKNTMPDPHLKMIHIPNGVNTDIFRPINKEQCKRELCLESGKKYALFVSAVGTENKIKRFDRFKEILKILVGKGLYLDPLVLSGVERGKVPLFYNSSEILLLTSDHEGSPNAVKEAMACNVPVVSTDVGNVKEMLDGVSCSFVSSSKRPDEMADIVVKALSSEKREGRDIILEKKLDINSTALKIKHLYEKILVSRKCSGI